MTGHIVIDDVLPSEEFTQIKEAIMHDQFEWQFRKGIRDSWVCNLSHSHPSFGSLS